MQLLEMRIFAQLKNFAMSMKGTVIQMMNAKALFIVDQTIVQLQLGIQLTAVNQKVIKYFYNSAIVHTI